MILRACDPFVMNAIWDNNNLLGMMRYSRLAPWLLCELNLDDTDNPERGEGDYFLVALLPFMRSWMVRYTTLIWQQCAQHGVCLSLIIGCRQQVATALHSCCLC